VRLAAEEMVPGVLAPRGGLVSLAWIQSPIWLVVYALAAFRLTILWTRDDIPPMPAFRQYVATRWGHTEWSALVDCPWCAGVWWSFGVVLVASSPLAVAFQWVAVPLAIAAVVGLLADRKE
jgi:hypothetical protein